AAGVVGCRIIDSPRERLIAILTNNFVPCNGRFPPPEKGQIAPPGQQGLQGLPPGGGVGRDGQVDFNVSRVIAAHMPRLLFHKAMLLGGKKERRGQRPRR
ncbi:MAG: ferrous iron transporter B, partial [Flavonifractor plautii]|nr:ferrous iron transporter B [Flavonifractor plautii]